MKLAPRAHAIRSLLAASATPVPPLVMDILVATPSVTRPSPATVTEFAQTLAPALAIPTSLDPRAVFAIPTTTTIPTVCSVPLVLATTMVPATPKTALVFAPRVTLEPIAINVPLDAMVPSVMLAQVVPLLVVDLVLVPAATASLAQELVPVKLASLAMHASIPTPSPAMVTVPWIPRARAPAPQVGQLPVVLLVPTSTMALPASTVIPMPLAMVRVVAVLLGPVFAQPAEWELIVLLATPIVTAGLLASSVKPPLRAAEMVHVTPTVLAIALAALLASAVLLAHPIFTEPLAKSAPRLVAVLSAMDSMVLVTMALLAMVLARANLPTPVPFVTTPSSLTLIRRLVHPTVAIP